MSTTIPDKLKTIIYGSEVTIYNIEFNIYPAERGSRDSMGVPLEPDWPEEFELVGFDFSCDDTELSRDIIEEKAFDKIRDFVYNCVYEM